MSNKPEVKLWVNAMRVVRISDVGKEFEDWLNGQTRPYVEEDDNPLDWAYEWDYKRFMDGRPVVD